MADKSLSFQVAVDTSGVASGLRVATSTVDSASQAMRQSLRMIGEGAREASNPFDEVTHHVRSMRQEMFLGSFMARQIGELGVASKETAGMVAGLAGAFLVGNWTGLAIEATLKLVGAFNEMGAEEAKAREEVKKFGEAAAAEVAKATASVDGLLRSMKGVSQSESFFSTSVIPALEKQAQLKDQLMAANVKLAEAEAQAKAYVDANYHTAQEQANAMAAFTKKQRDEVAKVTEELKTQGDEVKSLNEQTNRLAKGEADKATKDAADKSLEDQKKIQDEWNAYRQKSYQTDLDNWKKHLKDVQKAQLKELVEEAESAKAQATKEGEIRKAVLDGIQAHNDKLKADKDAQDAADAKALKEKVRAELVSAKQISEAFGATFAGIVTGTTTVEGAFKAMATTAVRSVIDAAIKIIQADALVTAAEAAKSQAGIPIVGPILAVAALGAMEGLITGLLGSLPSAAGGFDIPRTVNPITQLHGGEMVLPAKYADVVRRAAGGGSGGGTTHNHFHFPNAVVADEQGIRRFVESGAFRRATREAKRNGLTS